MNKRPHLYLRAWRRLKLYFGYACARLIFRRKIEGSPIYIVSCGHSGSSLLLNILGSHSRIYAVPGEVFLAGNRLVWALLRRFNMATLANGKKRWVEKTPKHIRCIEFLKEVTPHAKFIIIIRDGRDVALSIKKRFGSIDIGARRWVNDNLLGEAYWEDESVKVIRYEDLVEDPRLILEELLVFLNEPFEPECLDFHDKPKSYYSDKVECPPDATQKNHKQYRNWQINQPLFDGRGKWKQMSAEDKKVVKNVANKKLIEYGYVTDEEW